MNPTDTGVAGTDGLHRIDVDGSIRDGRRLIEGGFGRR